MHTDVNSVCDEMIEPMQVASRRMRQLAKLDPFFLLPGFAIILLAGLWLAVWHQLNEERQLAHHATLAKSQALAHTFAETSLRILQQVEHATLLFKVRYEESGGKLTLTNFIRTDGAYNNELPTDTDLVLTLYNAQGQKMESNLPYEPMNVASQAWTLRLAA